MKEDLVSDLRKSTQHSLEDISLLIKHMEHSGRIISYEDENTKTTIVKFIDPTAKDDEKEFTAKEKAEFFLKTNMKQIESKITDLNTKINETNEKCKANLLAKDKQ